MFIVCFLFQALGFIKFWNFVQGLQIFSSFLVLFIIFGKMSKPYVYSRPYIYSFCQNFQALCLFPALRLFWTLEYDP